MSNEQFVPAQPGCLAWGIMEVDDRCVAYYAGEVVAWRMEQEDWSIDKARPRFVARPVLLGEWPMGLVVVRNGRLYGEGREYYSFESWLRSEGLVVMAEDADRARKLYGVGDDLVAGRDEAADLIDDLRRENEVRAEIGSKVEETLRLIKGVVRVTKQNDGIHIVAGVDGDNVDGKAMVDLLSRVGASAVTAV
ncbi:hypothetical protein [Burkholderia vietnamiensis]|uniref:hypothetical protein n=1 Tax=Burkholderia vietnamiensis TaxID=60552 RepID=UPI001CF42ED8|nr:hypothetical protein [Burkholderia vietnamiensis]MCA8285781.1 hypothetical protein [Burkholderia vietnamiensis]